jgi:hypothetical protein
MSVEKAHKNMDKLDKYYKVVLQNSAKGGINTVEIADKIGVHRTSAYDYLNSLELMGKIKNEHGRWLATTGEQTIKPLEKEIVIELPIPKNQWPNVALLDIMAKDCELHNLHGVADLYRTTLEYYNKTRTIKITGKNVDDLTLEKLESLILQADEKSSKVSFRGLFKNLKRS